MFLQVGLDELAGIAADEAQGYRLDFQSVQHQRHVDPFTAGIHITAAYPVGVAGQQFTHPDRAIHGRVQGDGSDHLC